MARNVEVWLHMASGLEHWLLEVDHKRQEAITWSKPLAQKFVNERRAGDSWMGSLTEFRQQFRFMRIEIIHAWVLFGFLVGSVWVSGGLSVGVLWI